MYEKRTQNNDPEIHEDYLPCTHFSLQQHFIAMRR